MRESSRSLSSFARCETARCNERHDDSRRKWIIAIARVSSFEVGQIIRSSLKSPRGLFVQNNPLSVAGLSLFQRVSQDS